MPTIICPWGQWVGGLGSASGVGITVTNTSNYCTTQVVYCNANTATTLNAGLLSSSEQYIQSGNYLWYDSPFEAQLLHDYQQERGLGEDSWAAREIRRVGAEAAQRMAAFAAGRQRENALLGNEARTPRVEPVAITEAQQKAEKVLLAFLSPEQREMYKRHHWFDVRTPRGRYRLHYGWAGNIAFFGPSDEDCEVCRYCIHPREGTREFRVPEAENLLSQKLMLEFEEHEFIMIANRHAPRLAA